MSGGETPARALRPGCQDERRRGRCFQQPWVGKACLPQPIGHFREGETGRVERRRDRFRPMASCVSALSSIVANGHQVLPTFPPPPLIIPYGGFSRILCGAPHNTGYVAKLVMWRNFRKSPILLQIERTGRHITIRACWAAEAPFAASLGRQAQEHAWTMVRIEQDTNPANTGSNRLLRVSSGLGAATRRSGVSRRERSLAEQ